MRIMLLTKSTENGEKIRTHKTFPAWKTCCVSSHVRAHITLNSCVRHRSCCTCNRSDECRPSRRSTICAKRLIMLSITVVYCTHLQNFSFFSRFIADRLAVIILGIITLIAGVLLSSIPWLDYFLLKVRGFDDRAFSKTYSKSITIVCTEPEAMEQHTQLPLLAAAGRHSAHQAVHIQRDQSGRVSIGRKTQTGRSRSVCLQVRNFECIPIVGVWRTNKMYEEKTLAHMSAYYKSLGAQCNHVEARMFVRFIMVVHKSDRGARSIFASATHEAHDAPKGVCCGLVQFITAKESPSAAAAAPTHIQSRWWHVCMVYRFCFRPTPSGGLHVSTLSGNSTIRARSGCQTNSEYKCVGHSSRHRPTVVYYYWTPEACSIDINRCRCRCRCVWSWQYSGSWEKTSRKLILQKSRAAYETATTHTLKIEIKNCILCNGSTCTISCRKYVRTFSCPCGHHRSDDDTAHERHGGVGPL